MAKTKAPEKPAPAHKAAPPKAQTKVAPAKATAKVAPPNATAKVAFPKATAKVAFPKKAQPPTHAEFAARLPAPVGKRFEMLRSFLTKRGASEDFFYYGPRTGWACRYLIKDQSLCSILLSAGHLIGIVALDTRAQARVAWNELSDVGKRARKVAHGTPSLLWMDVPLDATGAADFKALIKAKVATS
jgi:hypothetical protein